MELTGYIMVYECLFNYVHTLSGNKTKQCKSFICFKEENTGCLSSYFDLFLGSLSHDPPLFMPRGVTGGEGATDFPFTGGEI